MKLTDAQLDKLQALEARDREDKKLSGEERSLLKALRARLLAPEPLTPAELHAKLTMPTEAFMARWRAEYEARLRTDPSIVNAIFDAGWAARAHSGSNPDNPRGRMLMGPFAIPRAG